MTAGQRLRLDALARTLSIHAGAVALTHRLVPMLIALDEAADGWRASLLWFGMATAGLLAFRSLRDLAPLAHSPKGAPDRRTAAHDFPFQIAKLYFTVAVVGGALTWAYLARFAPLSFPQTLAGAVTTYLLLALPVLLLYQTTRQRLRDEAAGPPGAGPVKGVRQSVTLRVGLAVQLPVVVCMAGLVLVEQSNNQRYARDVNAFYEAQYTNVLARTLQLLPNVQDRHEVVAALTPPPGVTIYSDEDGRAREAGVGVVIDPDLPRPLSLRLPPLLLFTLVALFAAMLGRWLSREVTAELREVHHALTALRTSASPEGAPVERTSLAETAKLLASWRETLAGYRRRRDALDAATEVRRQAERSKARFLAHLSHELKSPLNTILGFSEMLMAGMDGPLSQTQRERLGVLWRAGDGLLRFILSLLDLARLEAYETAQDLAPATVGAEGLRAAVQEQWRSDPLACIRLAAAVSDDAVGLKTTVEVHRTGRALLLAAGVLLDAVESGTAEVRFLAGPVRADDAPRLAVTVRLIEAVAEPHDATRLWSQLAPSLGGTTRGNAAATALSLIERIVALQAGELQLDGGEWPTFRFHLPPAQEPPPTAS